MFTKSCKKILIILFALTILHSCMSVDERMYNVSHETKITKVEDIVVSYSKPEKKHLIIGELSIKYNSAYKREMILNLMAKKAAKLGADGIILNTIYRANDNWSVSHHEGDTPSKFQVKLYVLSGAMYQYLK
ncbi:MAG: hypothetical protein OEV78_02245 [Spirochaetia bacterium]|nr:hypothetical protein [Spirochaetia bacterium]